MSPSRKNAGRSSSSSSIEEGLLTSQDLFGDLVDGAIEDPLSRGNAVRNAPIRVQVGEPGIPHKGKPDETPTEMLPADVAAILDAVLEPAEKTSHDVIEEPPEQTKPASPAPRTGARATASSDRAAPDPLDQLLAPESGSEAAAADDDTDAQADALASFHIPPSTTLKFGAKPVEAPAAHMAPAAPADKLPKFAARSPRRGGAAAADSLDLAAVIEDALGVRGEASRPSAARKPPEESRVYGPYQLMEKIAAGGMAEVFRAKRTGVEGFEKVVAVKRILSHLSNNPEFVDMFINEAKIVASLSHPNIVQIFDLGKIEKTYYIAMEFVHGRDLRTILKHARERGMKLPLDLSILLVKSVCLALEYAYRIKDQEGRAMRIVHRDISPQNILISFEGEIKLTDFGIAKAATKARSTDSGALRGKLLYMSPEQAWGRPMDQRSDLFSLGLVFYEMVTDKRPFLGSSESNVLEMVRQCLITPPTTFNPRIPEKLERVIMKTLARAPEERYQDTAEMSKDLDRVLQGRPAPTATDLARFMSVLFDEHERGVVSVDDDDLAAEVRIEMEFDNTGTSGRGSAGRLTSSGNSLEKLFKRIGGK
ncbi:MAG: serine/threonine protein kinase [Vicinamibacteria bacterium]|nr:serine/threonine protein kinase [Vicinamibacteria bacterium]